MSVQPDLWYRVVAHLLLDPRRAVHVYAHGAANASVAFEGAQWIFKPTYEG